MRSRLFLAMTALATVGAGCASSAKQTETIDTTSAAGEVGLSVPAGASAATLSRRDVAVFRRPPAQTPVAYPAGVAALITAPARWDAYLAGDTAALSAAEQRGLVLFVRDGCSTCHDGLSLGGQMYRKLGEAIPLRTLTDSGRFSITGDPTDLSAFKVASLRNVQLTPPYLHDGSVKALGEAVRLMSRHQLGVDLTEDQVSDIRAYLTSLTGRLPYATQR